MTTKQAKKENRVRITSAIAELCPQCGKQTPAIIKSWPDGVSAHHICRKCKIRTLSYSALPETFEWIKVREA